MILSPFYFQLGWKVCTSQYYCLSTQSNCTKFMPGLEKCQSIIGPGAAENPLKWCKAPLPFLPQILASIQSQPLFPSVSSLIISGLVGRLGTGPTGPMPRVPNQMKGPGKMGTLVPQGWNVVACPPLPARLVLLPGSGVVAWGLSLLHLLSRRSCWGAGEAPAPNPAPWQEGQALVPWPHSLAGVLWGEGLQVKRVGRGPPLALAQGPTKL